MDYEQAFIRDIRANPEDEISRLIFADWLEEQGEPQGELIRVQCELEHLAVGAPRRLELNEREQELLTEYADEWLEPLRELGVQGVSEKHFHKGLIEHVRITAANFLENGEELCRITPALHTLEVKKLTDSLATFQAISLPEQITGLDLGYNRIDPAALRALSSAPWISQLKELSLRFNPLTDEGIPALLDADFSKLRKLNLSRTELSPVGIERVAEQAQWPELRELLLSLNRLSMSDSGSRKIRHPLNALGNAHDLNSLEVLDLTSCGIDEKKLNAEHLVDAFPNLETLILRNNPLTKKMVAILESCQGLTALQTLDLRNCQFEVEGHYGSQVKPVEPLVSRFPNRLTSDEHTR